METKLYSNARDAVVGIESGTSLAVGGFGLCGIPDVLITAIAQGAATDLDIVSNNCGVDGAGLGILLEARRVKRVTASYVGENSEFARQYLSGELEVELTPQGTLAERLRAGGMGIPAFYTPAGVGTPVADGGLPLRCAADGTAALVSRPKEVREFRGKQYVLEEAIRTDFALVHAKYGDTAGNLVFDKTAMNFNPLVAMAGAVTVAQVEHLLECGQIDPAAVHLPGIFVQRIVETGPQATQIEKRKTLATKDGQ